MTTAADIYQTNLDEVTNLLWARDYEGVCRHLLFPSRMETNDKGVQVENAEQMILSLRSQRDSLERLGAQGYHRLCLAAEFDPLNPDRIVGRHRTYVLRGGTYVIPPYEADMALERVNGRWLCAGLRAYVRNADAGVISPSHGWEQLSEDDLRGGPPTTRKDQ
ncbi:hypothetical protein [Jannaschia sp. M317]|uniref:hypothetical protein n=1 Tax=Jannaschia sp. M317 TaxID=2867011 RepID=UPI0021A61E54|nr:hypothetical protein [Jannaschia sp. M317]UWQ16503.1 hypothetical protein K3551_11310 [Jannaschia sp. M317]